MKNVTTPLVIIFAVSKKLKVHLPYHAGIICLSISFLFFSLKKQGTCGPISRDKKLIQKMTGVS
jgi:hypothetical protein